MRFGDQTLSTGSAFFWEHDGRTFLLTNWHNLAGRNPLTGAPMSKLGALPNSIKFWTFIQVGLPDENGFFAMQYLPTLIPICDLDLANPRWLEHPTLGRKVDVAALDVTLVAKSLFVTAANRQESDAVHPLTNASDVFVIGFPFGQIANAPAPVWKRASVALDPTFDIEGLPKILVDTATREGMSGSVVIARHHFFGRSFTKKDGTQSEPILIGQHDVVCGIYSGRHYADLEKAQLGIVWKRSAIEDIVVSGTRPTI